MQLVKQPIDLPIKNIDVKTHISNTLRSNRHSILFPNSIRCIMCGPSNCGKTNVIISLLEDPNGLKFANVYLYSMSLYQPKYIYLKSLLGGIKEIGFFTFSSNEEVIPPSQAKPNSIFIFDDVITQKQNNIKSYFCMGRHNNIDMFYLTQSYAHIPKHLIRENTNFLILFKQRHIFNDFGLSIDISFEKFRQICQKCWSDLYGFMVLDIDKPMNDGKYRKGFDNFIKISEV